MTSQKKIIYRFWCCFSRVSFSERNSTKCIIISLKNRLNSVNRTAISSKICTYIYLRKINSWCNCTSWCFQYFTLKLNKKSQQFHNVNFCCLFKQVLICHRRTIKKIKSNFYISNTCLQWEEKKYYNKVVFCD